MCEQPELFLDSHTRGSSPCESARYTQQDDRVSHNQHEDLFHNAVICSLIADSILLFRFFVSKILNSNWILAAIRRRVRNSFP